MLGLDPLVNYAAKLRYKTGGQLRAPVVIKTTAGAKGQGVAHSQCIEAWLMGVPGLKVVAPSTAAAFFDQHWQKSALFLKRDEADRYRELIGAADASAVLSMAGRFPADAVEVIGAIRTNETSGESKGVVVDSFDKGATIRVKAIERFFEPLGELCRNLEEELALAALQSPWLTPFINERSPAPPETPATEPAAESPAAPLPEFLQAESELGVDEESDSCRLVNN